MGKILCFFNIHDLDYQHPQGAGLWAVSLRCKRCDNYNFVDWDRAANIALLETTLKLLNKPPETASGSSS